MVNKKPIDSFVSVIAPVVGDRKTVSTFAKAILDILQESYSNYELVLIDNGASQESLEGAQDILGDRACVRIVRLSQKESSEVAVFAGLDAAIGDYVIVMSPESDPPAIVPELVSRMRAGDDILFGVSEVPVNRTLPTKIGAGLFYWYSKRFLHTEIPSNATYLLGLSRRAVNALTRPRGKYQHVRHLAHQIGYRTNDYFYEPLPGYDSLRERGFIGSVNLAVEIAVTYSRHPLRFVSLLGLAMGSLNLIYAIYVVGIFFFRKDVAPGWTTTSLELSLMFFFVLVLLAVIAEYVGRTLEESRAQPPYNVMDELTSTVLVADETRRNISK